MRRFPNGIKNRWQLIASKHKNMKRSHKCIMEKAKALTVRTQVNIQDNSGLPFGQGNYGVLLQKLMKEDK